MVLAATAAAVTNKATAIKIVGSVGLTSKSKLSMTREAARVMASPIPKPAATLFNPRKSTLVTTLFDPAPKAIRIPIS